MVAFAVLLLCALHLADSLRLGSQPGQPMKDAVLASAYGYPPAVARNFLCSLRRTNFTGDIILFVSNQEQADTIKLMKTYDVIIHYLPDGDHRAQGRIKQAQACHDGGYRYCLLTDFRDVFFQRNPFMHYPAEKDLVFAQENKHSGTIGDNEWNKEWVAKCLDSRGKNSTIWNRYVVCSGTIVGTPKGLIALAEAMQTVQAALPTCHGGPLDQGLLNIILHWSETEPNLVPSLEAVRMQTQPQGNGIINTVGYALEGIQYSTEGKVLEADGKTVSAVIHQYDRSEKITEWVNAQMQSCDGV